MVLAQGLREQLGDGALPGHVPDIQVPGVARCAMLTGWQQWHLGHMATILLVL